MSREIDRYEIKLAFTADNKQAISQIQQLSKSLDKIGKLRGDEFAPIETENLKRASQAADELKIHLRDALNPKTGRLDLTRFATSLQSSNKDLKYFQNELVRCGTYGKQAFSQLAQTLAYADVSTLRLSDRLTGLGKTLANTFRWQVASTAIHTLSGAIQTAYGYAKNLNSSLNDIRIVTGHSVEYMDKFAEKANKAAKALSATTLDYTNSALTYYQQGK